MLVEAGLLLVDPSVPTPGSFEDNTLNGEQPCKKGFMYGLGLTNTPPKSSFLLAYYILTGSTLLTTDLRVLREKPCPAPPSAPKA